MLIYDLDEDQEHSLISHRARMQAASRSTWVSIAVNAGLTFSQVLVGLLAQSQSLVADGIHSLSDLLADFVVLLASHQSRKDADEDHPYGHQRFENAASLVLGVLLLAVGVGMLVTAFQKVSHPEHIPTVQIEALYVGLGALIAKELLFRYMLSVAKSVKSSMLVANAWHARSDAASSLVVSAGIVGNLMGYPIMDPIAALIIGILIGKMGWEFAWDALNDLVDRSATEEEVHAIRETLLTSPGVQDVHEIKTRKMGDMIVVDAHIEVEATLSVEEGHNISVEARKRVMRRHRVLNLMAHVDPWKRPDLDHDELKHQRSTN